MIICGPFFARRNSFPVLDRWRAAECGDAFRLSWESRKWIGGEIRTATDGLHKCAGCYMPSGSAMTSHCIKIVPMF